MENTRITEQQRKTNLRANEVELFKQSFIIVPYQVSGFIDYTNRGATNSVVSPEDFETFKRVWTGNDACVINWKNSIQLIQNQETKEMEVKFQLGEVFLGALETNYNENRVQQDVSFNEYTAQDISSTLTFRVDSRFQITDYYQLMFYKIPEISGSTLYRIETIEKDFVGRELVGYVITFKTINQDFANTGRARQQNVMPNAPGQGYLECIVEDSTWPERIGKENFDKLKPGVDYYNFYDRYITADYQKTLNRPVSKVIVRLLGNGILNTFVMEGRPVLQGDSFEKYRPQRLLFPYNFTNPTTPTLFHTQANSNNMYFGDFKPTLQYFKDLMTSIKDSLTPVNQWKYQGWLKYNYNNLKATNPIKNGSYTYDLYGYLERQETINRVPWSFSTEQKTINTSGIYGVENNYNIGGEKEIHNHMFDNFWTQKMIKVLPIDTKNTLTFGWTLASGLFYLGKGFAGGGLSVVGTILSLIGIGGTLLSKLLPKNLSTFRGLISAPLIDYNNDLFKNVGEGNNIPFNMLDNNTKDNPSSIFFAGNTTSISFEADITDLFTSERVKNDDGSYKTLSTINIGQKTFENGENILSTGSDFLLNGDAKLLPTTRDGYIIDSFKIQAVFNGEISVEFLDYYGNVSWSGIYQSEGKWTDSMREIWTEKNCSVFGRENIFFTEPVPYPKPIEPPRGDIPIQEQINVNTQLFYHKAINDSSVWKKLENDKYWLEIDTRGGRVIHCKLLQEQTINKKIKIFELNDQIQSFNDFKNSYQQIGISTEFKANLERVGFGYVGTGGSYRPANISSAYWNSGLMGLTYIDIRGFQLNEFKPISMENINGANETKNNGFTFYKTTPFETTKIRFTQEGKELFLEFETKFKPQKKVDSFPYLSSPLIYSIAYLSYNNNSNIETLYNLYISIYPKL